MPNLNSHVRSKIIGMVESGLQYKGIARRLGIHINTVTRTVSRYRTTGSTAELPRSGRPRVTTGRDDQYIRTSHLRDRFRSATYTARNLPNARRISAQTVRNRLRDYGIKTYRPSTKVSLTDRHKQARLAWCLTHVNWNHHQWRRVLFSDESPFGLQRKRKQQYVYRRRGERFLESCIEERDRHGGGKLLIWAGITFNFKTPLHFVNGNLTAAQYINQIVNPYVLPFVNRNPGTIFMQDGARPHIARVTVQQLNDNNVEILPWPSKSPDLNPIEHIWDALDRQIKKRPVQPRTRAELRTALADEWQRYPQYKIQRLISSMRRRCQACIAARGGHTKY